MKVLLQESAPDMWAQIRSTLAAVRTQAIELLESRLKGFECSGDEIAQYTATQNEEINERVAKLVQENSNNVILILQARYVCWRCA